MLFLLNLIFSFKIGKDFIVSPITLDQQYNINNNVHQILIQFRNLKSKFRSPNDKSKHQKIFQEINNIINYIEQNQNGYTFSNIQFCNKSINCLKSQIYEYNKMVKTQN